MAARSRSVDNGAGHGVLVVLLVDEDVLLVGVDVALLGGAHDVGEGHDVGHQGQGADDGHHGGVGGHGVDRGAHRGGFAAGHLIELFDGLDAVGILHRQHGPAEPLAAVLEGLLEEGEHLGEHAPDGQRVGAVLDPSAAVPQQGSHRRGQQQGDAAVPAVGGQAVVGVGEVPDVVDQDVDPRHVGPDHVLLVLRRVDVPPGGHAEDVEQAGQAVEHVVPAAEEPHALAAEPPLVPAHDGALEVGDHGDEDVDGHDDEGEGLEPVLGADAPFVLDHHEADAAGEGGVELGVVEPAVHVDVGLVVHGPFGTAVGSDGDGHEVDRQQYRYDEEGDGTAQLGAARKLVPEDQACQHHQQHPPLCKGISPINLEKHRFVFLVDILLMPFLTALGWRLLRVGAQKKRSGRDLLAGNAAWMGIISFCLSWRAQPWRCR